MVTPLQQIALPVVRPNGLPKEVSSTDTHAIRQWQSIPRTLAELMPTGASYAAGAGVLGAFINLIGKLGDMDKVRTIGKDLAIAGFAVLGGLIIHALTGRKTTVPEWATPEWEERQLQLEKDFEKNLFPAKFSQRTQIVHQGQEVKGADSPDLWPKDAQVQIEEDNPVLQSRNQVLRNFHDQIKNQQPK